MLPPLAPFLSLVTISTFTPGPNNLLSMTTAHQYGLKTARPLTFGISTAFTLIGFVCGLLDAVLLAWMPIMQWPLKFIGAGYMVFLAIKTLRSKPLPDHTASEPMPHPFWTGFGLTFLNPKCILFAISVMSGYIIPLHPNVATLALYALFLGFVCLLAVTCWSLFGTMFKRVFNKHARVINTVLALLLVYCAVMLFL